MSDVHGGKSRCLLHLSSILLPHFMCIFAEYWILHCSTFFTGICCSRGYRHFKGCRPRFYSGRELTKFFALLMLINNLAPILAPVLGGGIIAFTEWTGVFAVLSAIGFLLFVIVLWRMDETLPDRCGCQVISLIH